MTNKERIIDLFIHNFNESVNPDERFNYVNIKEIFISGKKNTHLEIKKLNKNIDKLQLKSDIYIKFNDDNMCGMSIKQSKDATKSNYSVHGFFGNETDKMLTKCKKTYLNENGFTSFKKEERQHVNTLFYPQNKENPYWTALRENINSNKREISHKLVRSLLCYDVPHDVYEFDGTCLKKYIKDVNFSDIVFEECPKYYLDKSGNERKTAKLFYLLNFQNVNIRVEVRWKGNVYNASPQFQLHDDSP